MLPLPSRQPTAVGPRTRGRSGKASPLVPALALLMIAGSLYGLWELTGGLTGPDEAPVTRGTRGTRGPDDPEDPGGTEGVQPLHPPGGRESRAEQARGKTPGTGPTGASTSPDPADGPEIRSRLAQVARGFRTATPDLRALNELIRSLAQHSTVLAASVEQEPGVTRGSVRLAGTDLEAQFDVSGDAHRILFVESSFDSVHPPFLRLELEISFETPRRKLAETRARLALVPNPERSALDHIGADEELRVGWEVQFGEQGATARGIGAWVARDLESWRVGPSDKRRSDKRVRDLSSFQAWRTTLAAAR